MSDYLNSNGLVDGKIPAGTACAFVHVCKHRDARCPTKEAPRVVAYSCATARLHSMVVVHDPGVLKDV